MPIRVGAVLRRPTPNEFAQLAYDVTGCFFEVHREFGRLFNERIYKREVARRFGSTALEVPVEVAFDGFVREFSVDMLIRGAAIFEVKATDALAPEHRAQILNYLLLTELPRGKLVNIRPELVEHEFVNTTLRLFDRRQFEVDERRWQALSAEDSRWKKWITAALHDWGTGLDLHLYEDAITEILGGLEIVVRDVAVLADGVQLGTQKVHFCGPASMFKVTSLYENLPAFEKHSRRFLEHTELEAIQWLNVQRHVVEFRTLEKKSTGK